MIFATFCGYISQRWVFAVMGFLALVNAYAMRACLSITITEMASPIIHPEHISNEEICTVVHKNNSNITIPKGTYNWTEKEQGIILSSFYWGYVIAHIPAGYLAERFGGKYSLGLGILSTAIFTLFTPLAVDNGGINALIFLRILTGLGEGTTFPALNAMIAQWTPPEERSKIGSLVFSGSLLGTVISTTGSGYILHHFDWPTVFYAFGGLGIAWFVFWVILCYNNPREHPFISEKEAKFLQERLQGFCHKKPPPVPWRYVLRSVPLYALICAQIGHDWGFFTMVTDLPKYMSSVLKFSIKENGLYSSLPYIFMWISSYISSCFADWMIAKDYISITNMRKIFTTVASIGPGLFIILASYSGCDQMQVVIMFSLGMTLMGTFYPGMKVNALDLSPNYSGTLMAMINGTGALTGIITPYIVGILTTDSTLSEWRLVFWIVFGVFVVTNLVFIVFASGEIQPWNDPEFLKNDKERREKEKNEMYDKKFVRA